MAHDGKITQDAGAAREKQPLGLHMAVGAQRSGAVLCRRDSGKYLESTYGTAAVHERGLRVYTTLNVAMQRAADRAVRDGLHAYDRRHGWRGKLAQHFA